MLGGGERPVGPFNGPKASYVVLSALTILGLALIISIWHGDLSSSIGARHPSLPPGWLFLSCALKIFPGPT